MATREELQNLARIVEVTKASFDEVEKQLAKVEEVLVEHDITLATLNELITVAAKGSASAFLSIGSGVTIPYKHQGTQEGLVMIDLGSGIFGEKPWSEAVKITQKRKEDISVLCDQLQTQAQALETKIGESAEQFNQMAMAIKSESNQNKLSLSPSQAQEEVAIESEQQTQPAKARRPGKRRSGMFGNELTLDD
jgi:prefoldin alpha subunit